MCEWLATVTSRTFRRPSGAVSQHGHQLDAQDSPVMHGDPLMLESIKTSCEKTPRRLHLVFPSAKTSIWTCQRAKASPWDRASDVSTDLHTRGNYRCRTVNYYTTWRQKKKEKEKRKRNLQWRQPQSDRLKSSEIIHLSSVQRDIHFTAGATVMLLFFYSDLTWFLNSIQSLSATFGGEWVLMRKTN